jgi:hypothetical protein
MIKFLLTINYIFGEKTLLIFVSLLLGLYYFLYRKHEALRKTFVEFKQAFLPAFKMTKDDMITYEQIIYTEFPAHKNAMLIFLHNYPLSWYRRIYFERKWKEYEKAYTSLNDFLSKVTAKEALIVSRRGENRDTKRKEQLLGHLKCLLRIANQY